MTLDEARVRFKEIVDREGKELVAAKLNCSVHHVVNISEGEGDKDKPGLQIAAAIEEAYKIPMNAWVRKPAARKIA